MNWRVSEDYTHSDHQAIHYEIGNRNADIGPAKTNGPKWLDSKLDEEAFKASLEDKVLTDGTANTLAEQLMSTIEEACDSSMPRRVENRRKPPV
ncbi:hypothetical protein, partial [Streptomyces sp. IBSBF 2390]|uniref:hypothetical protein n=1 Tax=Streptomyces sp. IBSBF 2390 TaxID=2903533 RepID=UPI002FDBA22B